MLKKKSNATHDYVLQIRLPRAMSRKFNRLCKEKFDTTMSNTIREWIEDSVKNHYLI